VTKVSPLCKEFSEGRRRKQKKEQGNRFRSQRRGTSLAKSFINEERRLMNDPLWKDG